MPVTRAWRTPALALAVACAVLILPWAPVPAPAAAQESPCRSGERGCQCRVVEQVLVCHLVVTEPGGPAAPPDGGEPVRSDGDAVPTAVWERLPIYSVCDPLGEGIRQPDECSTSLSCTLPDGRPGFPYSDQLVDVATNEVLDVQEFCYDPEAAAAPAPVPTPPPTMAQVLGAVEVPEQVIGRNPSGRGLTGLASWFWVDDAADTVAVDLSLQGWTVSGSLQADEWRWTVGDATYTSAGPGSEADPAVEHVFERKGTVEVTVEVAWSGSYTVSGYGVSFTVPGLATTSASSVDYEVIEVRGVVDAPEGDR